MLFHLYDASTDGNLLGNTGILSASVSNGLFIVLLDFGNGVFDGNARWLEINVQTNGGPLIALSPRRLLTATPYAIMANTASNLLGALPAGQLSGILADGRLPASLARL